MTANSEKIMNIGISSSVSLKERGLYSPNAGLHTPINIAKKN
jgi:hypothetical protein